jgi:hypothetical protein
MEFYNLAKNGNLIADIIEFECGHIVVYLHNRHSNKIFCVPCLDDLRDFISKEGYTLIKDGVNCDEEED